MSEVISNVNLNNVSQTGNTGNIPQYLEPSLGKALVLVPKGTIIPKSALVSQAAFLTYITAAAQGFIADLRKNRWFAFVNLDDFKNETKKASTEDTGLNQLGVIKYNPKWSWRYLSNMGNFIEALTFHNMQAFYDFFIIDAAGVWQGRQDPTGNGGLAAYSLQQIWVDDREPMTDKTNNAYRISVQMKNRLQANEQYAGYAAGTDADSILMLQNVVFTDVTAILGGPLAITATTDVVLCAKMGQGSVDFVQYFQTVLTKACFLAYNLSTGAAATISTATFGEIAVAGQTYYYAWLILSAAPAVGNNVQYSLAAPSAVNAIIPNADVVTELPNVVVHTF